MIGRLILVAALMATTAGLSACTNTAKGVGRDISNVGK